MCEPLDELNALTDAFRALGARPFGGAGLPIFYVYRTRNRRKGIWLGVM